MYHYVEAVPELSVPQLPFPQFPSGPWAKRLTISARSFKQEMDYLAANGYHPVTLAQIYDAMTSSHALPPRPVALTFDDGGADNYTTAFPILKRHHFAATFFVVTAVVGKPGCMSWAQLRTMSRSGMAIESHTVHHRDLIGLSTVDVLAELVQSRQAIKSHLGLVAEYLAYPDGGCDQEVMAATQAAGYRAALADKYGVAEDVLYPRALYDWPREGIGPQENLALFKKILSGTMSPPVPKNPAAKPNGVVQVQILGRSPGGLNA